MTNKPKGKRRHPRKIAAWPAWVKFHRSARYLKGKTANVSRGGAYITMPLDGSPAEGDAVSFILGMRGGDGGHYVIQAVSGEAEVVRVKKGADGGLALKFASEEDID